MHAIQRSVCEGQPFSWWGRLALSMHGSVGIQACHLWAGRATVPPPEQPASLSPDAPVVAWATAWEPNIQQQWTTKCTHATFGHACVGQKTASFTQLFAHGTLPVNPNIRGLHTHHASPHLDLALPALLQVLCILSLQPTALLALRIHDLQGTARR